MTKGAHAACLILLLSTSCWAASRVECDKVRSRFVPPSVHYCALLPDGFPSSSKTLTSASKPYATLYFLHGLGQDDESLFKQGIWNLVDDMREQKKIGDFVIITPFAGRSFYVNSKDGKTRYEDFLLREFIPTMEKKYHLEHSRRGRAISGISMGGYGALRLAFKHPDMFAAVSAHSAALIEELPKGAAQSGMSDFVGTAFGHPLDNDYWKKQAPFAYAKIADLKGLKIYFDCGDQDQFGFDAGARALDRLLTARKVPHEFHIYPGGHDWQYFAEHLPASLEFDSKALRK
jgi:S-formylglutathione hydrolase FrmB